ncbi:MAG TPA: flavin reductase family protein [Dehalococcoidia bacterium]|jgi:flavin reductase (DIM6/NTAB) family NADH-FMN oxidoreductase RutF|nr:flavin reductase family protein [Dehalococcoidia bacterium]
MRRSLDELDARRLLGGGPVLLVSSSYRGRHNVMPVAYAMNLSIKPPLVGIALDPSRYTTDILRKTNEFAINIPSRDLLHHVQYLGTLSGADFDKLELTNLPTFQARRVGTVLLEGCVGWIECALEDMIEMGDHFLAVGRVVAVSADDEAFNDHWLLTDNDAKPLHFLGGNYYAMLDYVMEARVPQTAEEYGKRLDEAVLEQLELTRDAEEQRAEEDYERDEFRRREGFER